jgi:hypothetical protein
MLTAYSANPSIPTATRFDAVIDAITAEIEAMGMLALASRKAA